jgi:hypothetical protein
VTRKDYITIARAFSDVRHNYEHAGAEVSVLAIDTVAAVLCQLLREDNPRFDSEHFKAVVRGAKALNSRP